MAYTAELEMQTAQACQMQFKTQKTSRRQMLGMGKRQPSKRVDGEVSTYPAYCVLQVELSCFRIRNFRHSSCFVPI